eukprot:TRINITY_DN2533_c0_g1_i1.p1 TRINITY_DN2533_c0_g1~~TRINITY_DN2533_c0_g1_i1.p1  ORF type:complete len:527 (-),score=161.44 TRINITY_DN2533_c0_g1_i1:39-1619(-)
MATTWGDRVGGGQTKGAVNQVSGTSGIHSFAEEEKLAFVDWINGCLKTDPHLGHVLPIANEGESLFTSVHDGLILCKLINDAIPGTIDERAINLSGLNVFKIHENQNLAINSAASIGCSTVNIGSDDLMEGTHHIVLGLIWQIIKIGLLSKIDLLHHPELYRLLEEGETLEDLMKLSPEQILLRWVNYHLRESGSNKRIENFSGDIKDSEAYTILLDQIAPASRGVDTQALNIGDLDQRAELVLENADKLDCRKFLRPRDITMGHPKLNLAFVANLFNMWPGLEPIEEEVVIEIIEETREEKTFRNWMNSLGVNPFVSNLYGDLIDGMVLLQLFDKIQPGIVDWDNKVNIPPFRKIGANMKMIENCNYAVELGHQLGFSLVGIDGKNIYDEDKVLVLGLVWQMMRAYTLSILEKMGGGQRITDPEIIEWANGKCSGAGKSSSVRNFKDSVIKTVTPIADLVDSIQPGTIDYGLLGGDLLEDASYVISSGRKIGGVIFALPEDIVEGKDKMIMTIYAALMAVDLGHA